MESLRALASAALDDIDVSIPERQSSSASMTVHGTALDVGSNIELSCLFMGLVLSRLTEDKCDWDLLLWADAGGASACQTWLPAQAYSGVANHALGLLQHSPAGPQSCEGFGVDMETACTDFFNAVEL